MKLPKFLRYNKKHSYSNFGYLCFLFFIISNSILAVENNTNSKTKHAFHTSITQLEYNTKNRTYEISIRIFSDDFAKAIDLQNHTKNTIIRDGDKNDNIVLDYINKHFSLISDINTKINLKYIGKENEDLATWVYFEISAENFKNIAKISQTVMMELFDDQINIVNFKNGEDRKSLLFDTKNKIKANPFSKKQYR